MKNISLTLALILTLTGGQWTQAQAKSKTVCQGIEPNKGTLAFLLEIEWGSVLTHTNSSSKQEAIVHIKSNNQNQLFRTVFTVESYSTRCTVEMFRTAKIGADLAKIDFSHVLAHSCGPNKSSSTLTTYPDTPKAVSYKLQCQEKREVLNFNAPNLSQ